MNISPMLGVVRRLFNICRKELLVILNDPANRIVLLAPLLIESLLFGYAATYDTNTLRMRCWTRVAVGRRLS